MTRILAAILAALAAVALEARAEAFDLHAAIRTANEGDVLRVPPGKYSGPIVIDRPMTLRASDGAIIDGGGDGTIVEVTAPDVTIEGFTIRNTGKSLDQENSAIAVTAPRCVIRFNTLEDVLFGIYLKRADGSHLKGNIIGGKDLPHPRRGDAIRLWQSPDCVIEDNEITGSRDAVMWFSKGTIIRRNHVSHGRYGMHFMYSDENILEDNVIEDNSVGAFLMYSSDLTLRGNVFARNRGPSGFGVGLKDMDGLLAEDNLFLSNRIGLHVDNSPSNVDLKHLYRRNLFAYNDIGLAFMPSVKRNQFTENAFLDNVEQVGVLGTGNFRGNDFSVEGVGNWWSDYRGFDLDDDGLGDLPYKSEDLFEALMDREPRLRLFLFSPAQLAVDMAARAFPIVSPTPRVQDDHPLSGPPEIHATARPRAARAPAWPSALILLAAGLTCLIVGARPVSAPS